MTKALLPPVASVTPRERARAVLRRWAGGAEPDALAALTADPGLSADRSVVLDLAYDEYCRRRERGEEVDAESFCERFPTFRASIRRVLASHDALSQNPACLEPFAPPRWPSPGDTVADRTLVRELGRGGFARVFLATERSTGDRPIVVKLTPEGGGEARTLGRLTHPNIVPILSAYRDEERGLSVVCMPYLGAVTLQDLLDATFDSHPKSPPRHARRILEGAVADPPVEGPLPTPAAVFQRGGWEAGVAYLGEQLAAALEFLHGKGVSHRDLKPSNVLLTPRGIPLVLDFNLSGEGQFSLSRLGGTLPYMAPEQLRCATGEVVAPGPAADVFSLGVILYELLAGRHPFAPIPPKGRVEEVARTLLDRQTVGPLPLRRFNPRMSGGLARLLAACLAPDPAARPTAAALRQSLGVLSSRPLRPRLVAGILAVALVSAGGYLAFGLPPDPNAVAAREADALVAEGRRLLAEDDKDRALDRFRQALDRRTEGQTLAVMAYAKARQHDHLEAVRLIDLAIEEGYVSAALWNNRGYSYFQLGCLHGDSRGWNGPPREDCFRAAARSFETALSLDPDLQATLYNRAMLAFQAALATRGEPLAEQALADISKALKTGPVTAALAADASQLFALSIARNPATTATALDYMEQAVDLGFPVVRWGENPLFQPLWGDPRFKHLLKRPPGPRRPSPDLRLLDPLAD